MALPTQLQQTLPHLIDRWVPINPDIVASLQRKLTAAPQAEILRELRQDPALLCWCLLENRESAETAPSDFIQRLTSGALKFAQEPILPQSPHHLSQASTLQQRLLHKSLARTSASSVLAPYFQADGDMACTVSALAELGSSLIAWNYPHIFTRVMERAQRAGLAADHFQRQIDTWLGSMLGFTPFLLSLAVAGQCRVPEEISIGIGQNPEKLSPSSEALSTGNTLKKISSISDIYSRATLPEAGEYSLSRWETCRDELESVIGPNGIKLLLSSTDNILKRYSRLMPQLDLSASAGDTASAHTVEKLPPLFQKNLHIVHCSNDLQNALREFYRALELKREERENIEFLNSIIVEHAGFSRGAIYLAESGSRELIARYSIGNATTPWLPFSCSSPQDSEQTVVQAFLGKSPVIETRLTPLTTTFTGPIGHAQRAGALYLEHELAESSNPQVRPRAHFKAIQQALEDCLHLI